MLFVEASWNNIFSISQDGCILKRNKAKSTNLSPKASFCFIDFSLPPQIIKEERRVMELTNKITFGIAQENKLTISLWFHCWSIWHMLSMRSKCLSAWVSVESSWACPEHPDPKPACLQLPSLSSGSASPICVPYRQDCDSPSIRVEGKCEGVSGTQAWHTGEKDCLWFLSSSWGSVEKTGMPSTESAGSLS